MAARRPLTPTQRRVLAQLAGGCPNKIIASSLGVSEAAAKKHLEALRRRFGVTNRVELLRAAIEAGEVDLVRRDRPDPERSTK